MSETIEDVLNEGARQVADIIDADFFVFEARLAQAFPDLSATEYAVLTGAYAAHGQQQKREFVRYFAAALERQRDE
jgi:hypothetical protein